MNLTPEEYEISKTCYDVMKTYWRENYDNYFYEGMYRDVFDIYEKLFHTENSGGYYLRSNKVRSFHFTEYMLNFMAQYFASNTTVLATISSIVGVDNVSPYLRSNITTMVMNALVHDTYLISEEKLRNVGMQRLEHFYIFNRDDFKSFLFYDYDYYFTRLCGVPFHLRNLDLPKDHYNYFERYIKDPICGHPLGKSWMV